jgi:cholesterol transport system auxiliary component
MARDGARWLRSIAFVAALAGCLAPRASEPPPHTYVLAVDETTGEAEPRAVEYLREQVLLVNLPQAESGFDTPKIAYLKRPLEVSYYTANQGADQPSRMLLPLLVRMLEKAGRWRAVIPMPTPARGDYRLDSTGFVLQQEFIEQPSRMRVSLRVQLVDLRDYRAVGTRQFEATEPSQSEDAYGGVLAANRALTKVLREAADWVTACVDGDASGLCH